MLEAKELFLALEDLRFAFRYHQKAHHTFE
jgi:hypothetical protein